MEFLLALPGRSSWKLVEVQSTLKFPESFHYGGSRIPVTKLETTPRFYKSRSHSFHMIHIEMDLTFVRNIDIDGQRVLKLNFPSKSFALTCRFRTGLGSEGKGSEGNEIKSSEIKINLKKRNGVKWGVMEPPRFALR